MAKKKLVIEIEFDEVTEDEDYSFLEFATMKIAEKKTTVTKDERESLAERWAQSDWYWVGLCNAIIETLDGKEIKAEDVRHY